MDTSSKRKTEDIIKLGKMLIRDIGAVARSYFLFTWIQVVINAFFPLVNVVLPKRIVDEIVNNNTKHAIWVVIIWFLTNVVYCLINQRLVCYFEVKNKLLRKHCERLLMEMIMKMEYTAVELAQTHERKEKARKGIDNILECVDNIKSMMSNIITLICATYMISSLNVFLALLTFAVVLFNAISNFKRIKSDIDMQRKFAALNQRWTYLNYICRDNLNTKEIHFNHLSEWLSEKISHFVQSHQTIIRDSFHNKSVAKRVAAFSYMIQKGGSYIYVGLQLWKKRITVGEFTQYIATVELVSTSLVSIISSLLDINKNSYLIEHYYEFLKYNDKIDIVEKKEIRENVTQSGIELKDVWFRYSDDSEFVLKAFSLNILPGECLALVGRNGCGKTTLIKLLLRLCKPEKGEILLNGRDIYEYSYDDYCRMFSVIFQDFKIFSFTILDNILMEDMYLDSDRISEDMQLKVENAIDKANLKGIIDKFPSGLDTYINKNFVLEGYEFSGGMQQALAMCRAYYREANNIILDEPTAMLDPASEARVYENFNGLIGKKTAIYISHRMSSSRFCDKIAYIDEGVVKEYGTHEELMQLDGLYAVLFKTQAELFEI